MLQRSSHAVKSGAIMWRPADWKHENRCSLHRYQMNDLQFILPQLNMLIAQWHIFMLTSAPLLSVAFADHLMLWANYFDVALIVGGERVRKLRSEAKSTIL